MQDIVQILAGPVIAENHFPQGPPIEKAVRAEDPFTKPVPDPPPPGSMGLHDFPGHLIGIDDRRPPLPQHPGNRAFARRDSAGQSDTHPDSSHSKPDI
jgi:hypothetical protein